MNEGNDVGSIQDDGRMIPSWLHVATCSDRNDSQADRSKVTIVIPVFRAATQLDRTLEGLLRQIPFGCPIKIIVANDGADPKVTAVCRRRGVSLVAFQPHRGPYFARNRALEGIEGDRVAFLDAGIDVPPGWLAAALQALGDADYLACEVDIVAIPGPTATEAYEEAHSYPIAEYMRIHHFGVTAGLLVNRRLLRALGGFDQRLRSGGDLEFGDRVHRAGFRQAYLAAPALLHTPRRAYSFFRKQFRVKLGYGRLARLYPNRFSRKSLPSCLGNLLRSLLPPHRVYIRSEFPPGTSVPPWRRYLFLWALKACRAAAELVAVLAPEPRSRCSQPRITWSDFSKTG
jgi:glycosyltransferase involved in cell wall biosynthesis